MVLLPVIKVQTQNAVCGDTLKEQKISRSRIQQENVQICGTRHERTVVILNS